MTLERTGIDFALAARGAVLNYVCRLVGDRSTAEDITQEVFAAVLTHTHFDTSVAPSAINFLKQKARWLVQDHYRRRARQGEPLPADQADRGASPPELLLEREEVRERVRRGVAGLPADHRDVVVRHLAGMDHEQIATDLGLPISVVYRRFHTAKTVLRRMLERTEPVPDRAANG